MAYEDAKHRPHAIHTGEKPENPITRAVESLDVKLVRWSNDADLFPSLYDALQSNWGDAPSRTVMRSTGYGEEPWENSPDMYRMGWWKLDANEKAYVEACFAGKTLQQVLEGITFDFVIDGVSRAFTHQNVRTRLGAGFMQHGGRDNDWRHRAWTLPETMWRMCEVDGRRFNATNQQSRRRPEWGRPKKTSDGYEVCIQDWEPIDDFLSRVGKGTGSISQAIEQHILNGRHLYAALVDAGIPWQDARRVLFMGMQTYIHDQYNYLALNGVLANRLEHIMDWEFNAVAQLMLREVKMKCPPIFSKFLGSHSDKAGVAKFAGLESWPPDGKYPSPFDRCGFKSDAAGDPCGRTRDSEWHRDTGMADAHSWHPFVPVDSLPRQHKAVQMPFFVLSPAAMAGGPIEWIATNGKYPHEVVNAVKAKLEAKG